VRILAIDTATERCSVALASDDRMIERAVDTPRGHADLILPMIDAVLSAGGLTLDALDGLAFGRGPGAFTGLRIAAGVVQGLALGTGIEVVGISDLAALALAHTVVGERAVVAIDARMREVYWAVYERDAPDEVRIVSDERVSPPTAVTLSAAVAVAAGTGFRAYPDLLERMAAARAAPEALPTAAAIAALAAPAFLRGEGRPAREALPVYLRDDVVQRR
jgi:tRNA threonylcarbamoyladenosine biosynthesis protein TsaB